MPPAPKDVPRPLCRRHAAGIGNPNDHGSSTLAAGLRDRQIGNAAVSPAPGKLQLADAPFRAPVDDALRGFRGQLILHISEEQEIGLLNIHGSDYSEGARPEALASMA